MGANIGSQLCSIVVDHGLLKKILMLVADGTTKRFIYIYQYVMDSQIVTTTRIRGRERPRRRWMRPLDRDANAYFEYPAQVQSSAANSAFAARTARRNVNLLSQISGAAADVLAAGRAPCGCPARS